MSLIKCYECSKEISDTAKACPHCGAGKARECHECSKQISENLDSCPNCGAKNLIKENKLQILFKELKGKWVKLFLLYIPVSMIFLKFDMDERIDIRNFGTNSEQDWKERSAAFDTFIFCLWYLYFLYILLITFYINRSGKIWERRLIIEKITVISIATLIIAGIVVFITLITEGEGLKGIGVIGSVIILGIIIFVWRKITGIAKKKSAK